MHIPGTKNVLADALSRRPDLCPEDDDNKDVVVLPEHLFVNLIDQELQKQISESDDMDYDAAAAIKGLLVVLESPVKRLEKNRRLNWT